MQLNMLEAMNIYVNVVEQGSFIRAAEVLELHRPAVTRAVQNLEHDLGVKLLHRTTRQVSMTDEGEEFYQRCLSLLSELDDVRRLFSSTQPPKGRLRLDVPITLARAVIIPALGDFQNRYPDIEIVLGTSDRKLAPFIASGELTEILTDFPPPPKPVSLLYPDRRYLAPKVRVFIDWLCEVFGPDAHL
ncbi:LysR family transcriptional regulator [Salmonella enterica subsp. enterica]|nr:LysR family transcriptional regulator [Salmonella enterica subsp. enterica serovar Sundsvall]